jgi:putative hydrolase of the HAD superfamily
MLKALIFDLDDTLLDRRKSLEKFLKKIYDKLKPGNVINYPDFYKISVEIDNFGQISRSGFFKRLFNEIGINNLSVSEYEKYWNNNFPDYSVPMENLYKMLKHLRKRKYKIGIITNGDNKVQRNKIRKLKIKKYLDAVLISSELGVSKPNKNIFLKALYKLKIENHEALYIGDNPFTDIMGAYNSEIKPVWFSNHRMWTIKNIREPEIKIDNLLECINYT